MFVALRERAQSLTNDNDNTKISQLRLAHITSSLTVDFNTCVYNVVFIVILLFILTDLFI